MREAKTDNKDNLDSNGGKGYLVQILNIMGVIN